MKCIESKNGHEVIRVTDEEAERRIRVSAYHYCPKRVWKERGTDAAAVANRLSKASAA